MDSGQEPAWLTAEQQRIWRASLKAVTLLQTALNDRLRPFDLDLGEYEILVYLSEAPGLRMRMSELADAVRQSRSRLTHTASRMETKGLIVRRAHPDDRRGVQACLTEFGEELIKKAAPEHVASVREALIDVIDPDDFAALGRVVDGVIKAAQ